LAVFNGPTKPSLWGTPRYQAEIAAPWIAAGLISFAVNLRPRSESTFAHEAAMKRSNLKAFMPYAALLVAMVFNLFQIVTLDRTHTRWINHPMPGNGPKTDAEYEITKAISAASANGAGPWVYYVGIWYGGFPAALAGMSLQDFAAFSDLNLRHRAGWVVDIERVITDPAVQAVIVEPEADSGAALVLASRGWESETFQNSRSGLKILLFLRPGLRESFN
jgi:hypothetical protein